MSVKVRIAPIPSARPENVTIMEYFMENSVYLQYCALVSPQVNNVLNIQLFKAFSRDMEDIKT